jgi:hypothetical protein
LSEVDHPSGDEELFDRGEGLFDGDARIDPAKADNIKLTKKNDQLRAKLRRVCRHAG